MSLYQMRVYKSGVNYPFGVWWNDYFIDHGGIGPETAPSVGAAAMQYERSFTKEHIRYHGAVFFPVFGDVAGFIDGTEWFNFADDTRGSQHSDNPARFREVLVVAHNRPAPKFTTQRYHGALEHDFDYIHDGGIGLRGKQAWQDHFDDIWEYYHEDFTQYLRSNVVWPVQLENDYSIEITSPIVMRATFNNRERRAISRRKPSQVSIVYSMIADLRLCYAKWLECQAWDNEDLGDYYPYAIINLGNDSVSAIINSLTLIQSFYGEVGEGNAPGGRKYAGRYGINYEEVESWFNWFNDIYGSWNEALSTALLPHSFAGDDYLYRPQVDIVLEFCGYFRKVISPFLALDWFNPAWPDDEAALGNYYPARPDVDTPEQLV